MKAPGAFPTLRTTVRLIDGDTTRSKHVVNNNNTSAIYDVKFYPYTNPDEDAVFAAVAAREVYVCRPTADPKQPIQILQVFRDPQEDSSLNSVVWTQDLETGDPLLCIAGAGSAKIKILNVVTGKFVRAIGGHGAAINDLAISPLSPAILASASSDHTIRIWNLDPQHKNQPCAAMLAGAGHKQDVLALGFHRAGQYLLSGGGDTQVNMWAMPDVPDANAGTDKMTTVYYPLFSSTEVHSNYVDCIRFYGDLVLSHSSIHDSRPKDNAILLWKIDGFSSADPTPSEPPLPSPGVFTRSAFGSRFQRLLTFEMPLTTPFYMRFSLFDQPGFHPILFMGNEKSKFSFWDLQRLEEGADVIDESAPRGKKRGRGRGRGNMMLGKYLSPMNSEDLTVAGSERSASSEGTIPDPRYDISDPFRPIPPHQTITVPRYEFSARQVAWSNCGKWCVAVGDYVVMCLFKRWDGPATEDKKPDI